MVVGGLIGKLFGADGAKNETLLRAYGKLPMYAEYRRLEVSPGTPTVYSQWMDAGRLAWVRSPTKSDQGVTRASRLLVQLPGAKEVVIASLWDSRDSLGRVFPFSFFITCPVGAVGDNALQRWVSAAALFRTFDQFYMELGRLGTGGDFYKLYRKRVLPIRPDDLDQRVAALEQEARQLSAAEWFDAAIDHDQLGAGAWFAGLLRRVERWKAQPATVADLALAIPLAPSRSFGPQAAAWLNWLAPVAARSGRPVQVLMPADNGVSPRALNLILRDLLPDDFQVLTTDDAAYQFVEQIRTPPRAAGSGVPAEVPVDGNLYDWLSNHPPA